MKKLTHLFLLFYMLLLTAGTQGSSRDIPRQNPNSFVQIQTHVFSQNGETLIYFLYKIKINSLVFVKENDHYSAGFNLSFEIFNDNEFLKRESKSEKISVINYSDAENENSFFEGLIYFKLDTGIYSARPSISIDNTEDSYSLRPINIPGKTNNVELFWGRVEKNGNFKIKLFNTSNFAPYSKENYDLFISTSKFDEDSLEYKIEQNDSTILDSYADLFYSGKFKFDFENGLHIVASEDGIEQNIYRIKNLNEFLIPGHAILSFSKKSKLKREGFKVVWLNKPSSLFDPEFAIELLLVFEKEKTVDALLKYPKDQYLEVLLNYWKKFDRTPKTTYNEVMAEFYKRADYALTNFESVNNKNGAKSDRGKTYIVYGKPDSISRNYTDSNSAVEVWHYQKINKDFVFVDTSGLGNYKLENSK